MPSYYLVSLSNRTNLDLCMKFALAGFTDSGNGFWTYNEIEEGDFISFLYGAQVWNLYQVKTKTAFKEARDLPPWPPVTFRTSGKSYYFPFRLQLEPVREMRESLVRPEFAYVARNLLLRGGYRKTHFQADQTTLQAVSQMGQLYADSVAQLQVDAEGFQPRLTFDRNEVDPPQVYRFSEVMLQALLKKHLRQVRNLRALLTAMGLDHLKSEQMEVLGELALPEGQIDVVVKVATPIGVSHSVAVEVKTGTATARDIDQLAQYVQAMGGECQGGLLVAHRTTPGAVSAATKNGLYVWLYYFDGLEHASEVTFEELYQAFRLEPPG